MYIQRALSERPAGAISGAVTGAMVEVAHRLFSEAIKGNAPVDGAPKSVYLFMMQMIEKSNLTWFRP